MAILDSFVEMRQKFIALIFKQNFGISRPKAHFFPSVDTEDNYTH